MDKRVLGGIRTVVGLAALASGSPLFAKTQAGSAEVVELRQYKIVHGRRDAFIDVFERELIEGQEDVGMRLVGQFRDLDDPDRFTWIRAFPDMARRWEALTAFYHGPIWEAHKGEANPLLEDNDNVLLLRPATPGSGFPVMRGRTATGERPAGAGVVVASVHYLWKDPSEGFTKFFTEEMKPALEAARLPVIAAYVTEPTLNDFTRLPVRQSEKVFVWFTRVPSAQAHQDACARLAASEHWKLTIQPRLDDYEERQTQVLRLSPTDRSMLR
jgi:hypothetical protein